MERFDDLLRPPPQNLFWDIALVVGGLRYTLLQCVRQFFPSISPPPKKKTPALEQLPTISSPPPPQVPCYPPWAPGCEGAAIFRLAWWAEKKLWFWGHPCQPLGGLGARRMSHPRHPMSWAHTPLARFSREIFARRRLLRVQNPQSSIASSSSWGHLHLDAHHHHHHQHHHHHHHHHQQQQHRHRHHHQQQQQQQRRRRRPYASSAVSKEEG